MSDREAAPSDRCRDSRFQLRSLEAEAVFVIREVVAELNRPVLLFSGGKDSVVLLRSPRRPSDRCRCRFRCCTSTPGTTFPR